ncbi:MAG: permease, partial [Nitrospinae bacterium]|nr:permease [Nitrospinota bacterium]
VFLLAGPATNIGTLMVLRSALGGRSTVLYLIAICVSALGMGIALNALYAATGIDAAATMGVAGELVPRPLAIFAAVVFMALAGASFFRQARRRFGRKAVG